MITCKTIKSQCLSQNSIPLQISSSRKGTPEPVQSLLLDFKRPSPCWKSIRVLFLCRTAGHNSLKTTEHASIPEESRIWENANAWTKSIQSCARQVQAWNAKACRLNVVYVFQSFESPWTSRLWNYLQKTVSILWRFIRQRHLIVRSQDMFNRKLQEDPLRNETEIPKLNFTFNQFSLIYLYPAETR